MRSEVDWRHIAAAVLVAGLILFGGYRLLIAKPEAPRAKVVAGPDARMEDAPEHPTQTTVAPQGSGLVPLPPGITAQ